MLEFHQVAHQVRGRPVLRDVTFTVPAGAVTIVVGPARAGKTTVLSMPNRLIDPTSGEIHFDDRPLTAYKKSDLRRSIGWAGGPEGLFAARSVLDNIGAVPQLLDWPEHTTRARSYEALEAVGLPRSVASRRPRELDESERIRVDLARAIAGQPQLAVVDDPFQRLPDVEARELAHLIEDLGDQWCATWLVAMRDPAPATRIADRLVVLEAGLVRQAGSVTDIVDHPRSAAVQRIIGDRRGMLSLGLVPAADLPLGGARTVRDPAAVPAGAYGLVVDADARPEYWVLGREDGHWVELGLGECFDPRLDTMAEALDAVLTSAIGHGVAIDRTTGRYRGVVTADVVVDRAVQHRVSTAVDLAVRGWDDEES